MDWTINAAALTGNVNHALGKDNFSWELMRVADTDKNGTVTRAEARNFITEVEHAALFLDKTSKIDDALTLDEMNAATKFFKAAAEMANQKISKARFVKPDSYTAMITFTNKAAALEHARNELRINSQLAANITG